MQSVESVFPEGALPGNPVRGRDERPRIQPAVVDAALASPLEQSSLLQDLQVLRDRGERHLERLREVRDARLSESEPREDGAPGRVRERGEGPIERA